MSKKYPNMLEKYQQEIGEWSFQQFSKPKGRNLAHHQMIDTNDPLLGMMEELGELTHAVLKQKQQIRTAEDHEEKEKDAIGDLMIYLLDYCSRRGFSASEILKNTWETVSKRDWVGNPMHGTALDPRQDTLDQQRVVNQMLTDRDGWEHDPVKGLGMVYPKEEGRIDLNDYAHLPFYHWPIEAQEEYKRLHPGETVKDVYDKQ